MFTDEEDEVTPEPTPAPVPEPTPAEEQKEEEPEGRVSITRFNHLPILHFSWTTSNLKPVDRWFRAVSNVLNNGNRHERDGTFVN